jgi:hypothetical protein
MGAPHTFHLVPINVYLPLVVVGEMNKNWTNWSALCALCRASLKTKFSIFRVLPLTSNVDRKEFFQNNI